MDLALLSSFLPHLWLPLEVLQLEKFPSSSWQLHLQLGNTAWSVSIA